MEGGMKLQIEADNRRLEKILCDIEKLKKTIGIDMTRALKQRIDQLRAADNFKEYLDIGLGDPHPLVGNLDNLFGIKINRNYRLIVEPLSVKLNKNYRIIMEPLSEKLDDDSLRKCKKVNLKGVADYHDGKCEWLIP